MDDEELQQELNTLKSFFADLSPALVEQVFKEHDCDYKAAMEALAEIAKNPSAAGKRGLQQGAAAEPAEPCSPLRPPLSTAVSEGPPPSSSHAAVLEREEAPWKSELPPPERRGSDAAAWDIGSMAAALMDFGNSVSDGITGIADNISDFVSDLASAFDAGWDDHQEHGLGPGNGGPADRNRAAVVAGGMDSQRASNRRHGGSQAGTTAFKTDWVDEEDDKKDA